MSGAAKGAATTLDRVIEGLLTCGIVLSGAVLVFGLLRGDMSLLRFGIYLLMFTPVARVVVVSAALLARRDWIFGGISLWILAVLLSSLHLAGWW